MGGSLPKSQSCPQDLSRLSLSLSPDPHPTQYLQLSPLICLPLTACHQPRRHGRITLNILAGLTTLGSLVKRSLPPRRDSRSQDGCTLRGLSSTPAALLRASCTRQFLPEDVHLLHDIQPGRWGTPWRKVSSFLRRSRVLRLLFTSAGSSTSGPPHSPALFPDVP